jgi:hypothetical protein
MIHSLLFGGDMEGVTDFVMVERFKGKQVPSAGKDNFLAKSVETLKSFTTSTVTDLNRTLTGEVLANVGAYLVSAAFPVSSCFVVPVVNYLDQKKEKTVLTREKIVKSHVQQVK